MARLSVMLPDSVVNSEAQFQLAARLYQLGRLSLGQAAEVAGYTKPTFIELLGKEGIAAVDYDPSELTDDLRHA